MGRKAKKNGDDKKGSFGSLPSWRRILLAAAVSVASVVVVLGILYAVHEARQFVLSDPRFALAPPPDFEFLSPSITVTGLKNAQESSIHAVFRDDFGRSIYLMDLEERRLELRNVEWVKDASVSRLWPNRILIHVVEREPVAYIEIPSVRRTVHPDDKEAGAAPRRFLLIDPDGYILHPRPGVAFHLPIVKGVNLRSDLAARRMRVGRMTSLLSTLDEYKDKIVEVDVSDLENLRVRREMPDHSVTLLLGNKRFKERMDLFDRNYPELRKFLPPVSVLDLTLEDRITEVHEGSEETRSAGKAEAKRASQRPPAPTATKPVASAPAGRKLN